MSVDLSNFSIAQWFSDREQHRCGYCKNPSGSISYGMLTEQLTVHDYKDLIDRGWRRSGKYCYKPTMDKTCCPQYTIRCNATEFTLSKSHKKIIKKFNKFLNDGIFNKNVPPDQQNEETSNEIPGFSKKSTINLTQVVTTDNSDLSGQTDDFIQTVAATQKCSEQEDTDPNKKDSPSTVVIFCDAKDAVIPSPSSNLKSTKNPLKDGHGPDPNKPPCKKAKLMRLERKKEKMQQKGLNFQSCTKPGNNEAKTLNQFLEEIPSTSKHKLKLKLIPTSNCGEEWQQTKDVEFGLYVKYQTVVHNDTLDHLSMRGFERFLVKSPLKPEPFSDGVDGPGYGSFHQQYWVDEKLIAVGVIDILPGCVSSVYFFYDPDYRDLTLGTFGSLREIQFVQNLCTKIPGFKHYYMGFYIHSCPKMRYKGKLNPSYLLCPETYVWVPIEICIPKLNASKYSRLNEDIDAIDENDCTGNDVKNIKVVSECKLMYVSDFIRLYKVDRDMFENLGNLVGKKTAHKMIFWID